VIVSPSFSHSAATEANHDDTVKALVTSNNNAEYNPTKCSEQ